MNWLQFKQLTMKQACLDTFGTKKQVCLNSIVLGQVKLPSLKLIVYVHCLNVTAWKLWVGVLE